MDPEIGAVYTVQGRPQRYRGGDPELAASWEPMDAPAESAEDAALRRTNARGGSALTDFLAMARHGLTLGFDDDVADAIRPGAGAEIRQRIEDRRLLNPGASALAEVAGGVALPVGAGGSAVRGGKGLLSGVTRGAAIGGAQGGMMGFGEATGTVGERAETAIPSALAGAAIGGAVGSLPGLLNAAARRAPGRGTRVGQELVEATGLPNDIERLTDSAEGVRNAASRKFYGPMDALGAIENPRIAAVLRESQVPAPDRPRTLTELQKVLAGLKGKNGPAAEELKRTLGEEVAGFAEANASYGPFARPMEALEAGRKSYKTAADIRMAMRGMSRRESRNFAAARLHDIVAKLETRDEDAVGMLRQFVDAGPETKAQLRTLFRGDNGALEDFLAVLRREESAEKVANQLPYAAGLVTLGGGGYFGLRGRTP